MKLLFTKPFVRDYHKLQRETQKIVDKQLEFLLNDSAHPSLRVKRIKSTHDLFEGRVTKSMRFSFRVEEDTFVLRRVGEHDKILRNP